MYRFAAFSLLAFTTVILAAMFGLTWVVVDKLKDTKLQVTSSGATMLDRETGVVVQVKLQLSLPYCCCFQNATVPTTKFERMQIASTDFSFHPSGYINTRISDGFGSTLAARTVPAIGLPTKISSSWPIDAFFDLRHIKVPYSVRSHLEGSANPPCMQAS